MSDPLGDLFGLGAMPGADDLLRIARNPNAYLAEKAQAEGKHAAAGWFRLAAMAHEALHPPTRESTT